SLFTAISPPRTYSLSLHDALPISPDPETDPQQGHRGPYPDQHGVDSGPSVDRLAVPTRDASRPFFGLPIGTPSGITIEGEQHPLVRGFSCEPRPGCHPRHSTLGDRPRADLRALEHH